MDDLARATRVAEVDRLVTIAGQTGYSVPDVVGALERAALELDGSEAGPLLIRCSREALRRYRLDEAVHLAWVATRCEASTEAEAQSVWEAAARTADVGVRERRPRRADGHPLRIAHIHSGAAERHAPSTVVRALVRLCDRGRFEPYTYLTEAWFDSRANGGAALEDLAAHSVVRVLGPSPGISVRKAKALTRLLADDSIDVAVFHTQYCPMTVMAAAVRSAPLTVGFLHASPIRGSRIDRYVAWGKAGIAALPEEYQGTAVDLPMSSDVADRTEASPSRRHDAFGDDAIRLGTTGSVFKYVDPVFLRAVASVLERVPGSAWLFAGRASRDELAHIRSFMEDRGVADRVLYAGELGEDEIPGFMKSLDVFVNSFPVPGGLTVVEAMAAGLPVVSLQGRSELSPGQQQCFEYIGDAGVVRHESDVDRFVSEVADLCCDAEQRARLATIARRRYESTMTARATQRRFDDAVWTWYHE